MNKRLLKSLCVLLLLPALLTGCWQEELPEPDNSELPQPGSSEPETAEGRVILPEIFSLPYAPDQSLDPITCPDGMQQVIASLLCEGLFRLDANMEPEPWLCSSYAYDPDTYRYEFTLRSGVTFSDGASLTAADVKATLDRARNSDRYRLRLSKVASVSTSGDQVVVVSLSSPNTAFPALLDIPIVKAGTDSAAAPTGTGPYLFSDGESGVYLVASQSWWQGTKQPTDRIALVEAADMDTMLYRFTSHDVQLVTADLTGISPITATGNIVYQDADTTILQYVGCNVTRAPLDSAALRRALSQSINRSYVVSAFLSGHAAASQFPISPVSALYPSDLENLYSGESISAALAELETPGRTLTLLVNAENAFKISVATYLAEIFTAGGIPVTVQVLPWEEYAAALAAGDFDLYYGEVKLTADWDLSDLLATGGTLNYGGWADEQTDRLLDAFAAADDRAEAARQLCARLQTAAPILPVCFKSTSVLMQTGVLEGLSPTMAEPFYDLPSCTIHLRES